MEEISGLDVGHSEIVSHDDPGFIKMLHGLKIHDWQEQKSKIQEAGIHRPPVFFIPTQVLGFDLGL